MKNHDNIADSSADFRERLAFSEACGLFPEIAAVLSKQDPSREKDKKSLVAVKRSYRLPPVKFAYLVLECINTNKTNTQIAKKFGVTHQNVAQLRRKLGSPSDPILYRRNGQLFFDFYATKESILRKPPPPAF